MLLLRCKGKIVQNFHQSENPGGAQPPGFLCAVTGLIAIQPLADETHNHTSYDSDQKGKKIVQNVHLLPAEVSGNADYNIAGQGYQRETR